MINKNEPITFITGNLNKLASTQRYITIALEHHKLDLTEIQSLDPKEVIEHKVKEAYKILKKPVLVEDTSLVFHGLGRLPGPFIKWFLEEVGNEGMCRMLDNKDRTASAVISFGYYNGDKLIFAESTIEGTISEHPRGENGYGWDPIFIPKDLNKTHAELTQEELDTINVRRVAIEKLEQQLKTL